MFGIPFNHNHTQNVRIDQKAQTKTVIGSQLLESTVFAISLYRLRQGTMWPIYHLVDVGKEEYVKV